MIVIEPLPASTRNEKANVENKNKVQEDYK